LLAHVPCPQLASPAGFGFAAPAGFFGGGALAVADPADVAGAAEATGAAEAAVAEAASVDGVDGLAGAVVGVVGAGAPAVAFEPHAAAEQDD
jgi:hypothetical protein